LSCRIILVKKKNTILSKITVQVGNPDGEDKPNKKFYDPRVWVRAAEESLIKRAHQSFSNLMGLNILGDDWPKA
jgi:hypothetical protein